MKISEKKLQPYWCEISLAAISHNVQEIKNNIGDVGLMAVLKSNAYGHGIVQVGLHLDSDSNVDSFGVYTVQEGVQLREAGVVKKIVVLGPILTEDEYDLVIYYDLEFMLIGLEELSHLVARPENKFRVHIKIDTGLHRFGFDPDQMSQVIEILENNRHIVPVGIASHLASLDDGMMDYTKKQIQIFDQAVSIFQMHGFHALRHTGAASSLLAIPEAHFDMIRVGVSIYGLWPTLDMKNKYSSKLDLHPALAFKTRIVYRKKVEAGDYIGYGGTFQAPKNMTIGILPLGYYEGVDRRLSGKGEVIVGGRKVSMIGRIAMNTTMIDLTAVPDARVGDEVILIGSNSSGLSILADEIADIIGTVPHEITTARIPGFVSRVYLR